MDLREKSESEEQLNQDVTLNSESTPVADADVVTENEAAPILTQPPRRFSIPLIWQYANIFRYSAGASRALIRAQ